MTTARRRARGRAATSRALVTTVATGLRVRLASPSRRRQYAAPPCRTNQPKPNASRPRRRWPSAERGGAALATIDFGPLRRHRDFRLLFFGQATTFFGSMITYVAIPFQAYQPDGLVARRRAARARRAGAAARDRVPRRRARGRDRPAAARAADRALADWRRPACCSRTRCSASPKLWVLFVVAAVMAGLDGLQRPPLAALTPRLVERDELPAAAALELAARDARDGRSGRRSAAS